MGGVRALLTSVAATSAAATAPMTAATATTVTAHLLQRGRDVLIGLLEDSDEIPGLLGVWHMVC